MVPISDTAGTRVQATPRKDSRTGTSSASTSTKDESRTGFGKNAKDIRMHTQEIIGGHEKNNFPKTGNYSAPKYKTRMQDKLISYLREDGTEGNLLTKNIRKGTKMHLM